MANPGATAALNAILWGSGYLYARRGSSAILLVLAHLVIYLWIPLLGLSGSVYLLGPIFLFGSLYFAIDGYRYASQQSAGPRTNPKTAAKSLDKRACANCGARVSPTAKFCPECGASQERN